LTQRRLFLGAKRDLTGLGQGQPHSGNTGSLGAEKLAHPTSFSTFKQVHHGLLLASDVGCFVDGFGGHRATVSAASLYVTDPVLHPARHEINELRCANGARSGRAQIAIVPFDCGVVPVPTRRYGTHRDNRSPADKPDGYICGGLFGVPLGEMLVQMTIGYEAWALHFLGFAFG
jgi:hypothetical protein